MFPERLFFIGALATIICGSLAVCPPAQYVVPCSCARDTLFCRSSITTTADLQRIMFALMGRGFFKIDMRNLKNLGNMSLPIFKVVYFTEMRISDSKLESILDPTSAYFFYAASYSLKVLKISKSINTTNEDFRMNLMSLRALKEIDLFGNNMKRVGNDLFSLTPETVTSISLIDNKIETLEDGTFEKFLDLEVLRLDTNKIKILTRSILPSSPIPLRVFSLGSNDLTSIPADMFYGMHFLSEIDISENKITEFPERTWSSIWTNIDRLNAKGNKLNCDTNGIQWMYNTGHPRNMDATCDSPADKANQPLSKVIDDGPPGTGSTAAEEATKLTTEADDVTKLTTEADDVTKLTTKDAF